MVRPCLALLAAIPLANAQTPLPLPVAMPLAVDSGHLANPTGAPLRVFEHVVAGGGDWLQVHCRDTHLPPGSRLRLHGSGRPDHVQWHDAHSLRDWRGWSGQLLGPDLHVALWAAPGTNGNRVCLDAAAVVVFAGADSLCDGSDDRVPSSDPRACRLGSFCSAWLFSADGVGTAGHCVSSGATAGWILHFATPPSSATGMPLPSHPDDQYALAPFLQFLDQGVGQDWAVLAAVRNSNTQLFPGQAQGWYTVAPQPPASSGALRVTGYGTGNGAAGTPAGNQAQKTHSGPRIATPVPDSLGYRADTTPGNSGSPVLDDATGQVVGVHTHGGCGNGTGYNQGTSSGRADWAAARQAALARHTVGGFTTFGQGCGGAHGVPVLSFAGVPELGRSYTVRVQHLNPQAGLFGLLVCGLGTSTWSGGGLPASLAGFGMPGCQLLVADHAVDGLSANAGLATRAVAVPAAPVWLGVELHYQYLGADPTRAAALPAVVSNGGSVYLGN
jgi:V8-like Glu-specific endopeptidase